MMIFDFDGVIVDSNKEVVVTAFNGVTGGQETSLENLPETITTLFLNNRFHFPSAGDALILMRWCLDQAETSRFMLLSTEEFNDLTKSDGRSLTVRTKLFFESRKRFQLANMQAWLKLHKPYYPLWDALVKKRPESIVILTYKNREAVLQLTHHFGLELPAENVYAGDSGASKLENFKVIHSRFSSSRYTVVDDCLKNLVALKSELNIGSIELKLLLANWGYLGPKDSTFARELGFASIDQLEMIRLLERQERGV